MRYHAFSVLALLTALLASALPMAAVPIQDPIADYLSMQVAGRSEYVGTLQIVKRLKIDIDGDGKHELFIGTWYRYIGSKNAFYWTAYKEANGGGYNRITPNGSDIFLRFDGIFAGLIQERSVQGLIQFYPSDTTTAAEGLTKGNLYFYYIVDGELKEEDRGEMDLSKPGDKATYERYFGEARQTRQPVAQETFTVGSSRVDLQACKLEYSIVSPK